MSRSFVCGAGIFRQAFVFSTNILLHPPLLLFAVALISVDLGILGLSRAAIAARTGRGRHGGGNMPLGQTTKSHDVPFD